MVNASRRALVGAFVALLAPSVALAQLSTTRGLSLGVHLQGTSLTVKESNETNSGGGLGLRVGYGFNRIVTGFLHVDGAQIDVPTGGTVLGQWNLAHAEIGARFHFANSNRRFVPYLEGAAGARAVSVSNASISGSSNSEDISFNGGAVTFGAGMSTFFKKRAAFDVSLKWTGGTFSEVDLGDISVRNLDIEASSFRFGVGLIFWP
jgi:hypothetical protein